MRNKILKRLLILSVVIIGVLVKVWQNKDIPAKTFLKILLVGISAIVVVIIIVSITNKRAEKITLSYYKGKNYEETTEVITTKSQCIWGTWVVTEYWIGRSCLEDSDSIGKNIGIYPHSFAFGDKECSELAGYVTECIAIKGENEYFREIATFQELGMTGNYFLEFHPLFHEGELDIFPFTTFLLMSSNEIMIPIASNSRMILEKVSDYDGAEDMPLMVSEYGNSICYGTWEIEDVLSGETEIGEGMSIGTLIEIRKKVKSFTSCKVLDEVDAIIGDFLQSAHMESKNEYLVYYNFSDDYSWDQMICIDDMTAIIVKEGNLFLIKRISNPVEDNVYHEIG